MRRSSSVLRAVPGTSAREPWYMLLCTRTVAGLGGRAGRGRGAGVVLVVMTRGMLTSWQVSEITVGTGQAILTPNPQTRASHEHDEISVTRPLPVPEQIGGLATSRGQERCDDSTQMLSRFFYPGRWMLDLSRMGYTPSREGVHIHLAVSPLAPSPITLPQRFVYLSKAQNCGKTNFMKHPQPPRWY
jgi:hypothetical protein